MHVSRGFRQSFLTLLTVLFATAAFAQATATPDKPAGQAADRTVRAAGRPARQGRRVGTDSSGARRQDARHGESDAERLRHGPRLG